MKRFTFSGKQDPRRGLTLIELVLVLVILSLLATVAIEMVEPQVDQTRFETTQRTVANVQRAIFDREQLTDGTSTHSGFLVDMGRLPQARADVADATKLNLSELWQQNALPSYAAVQAATANITSTNAGALLDADGDSVGEDTAVYLRYGWRGPYLQLPVGAETLSDGFGHRLSSLTTDASLSHLRGNGDAAIIAAGTSIYGVRSFGRSNVIDVGGNADAYENDVPRSTSGKILSASQLQGTVSGTVTYYTTGATAADIVVQIYYPNGSKIVVQRAATQAGGTAEIVETTPASVTTYQTFQFAFRDSAGAEMDFSVGPRMIRAYYQFGDASQRQSAVTTFPLTSPGNILNLAINN